MHTKCKASSLPGTTLKVFGGAWLRRLCDLKVTLVFCFGPNWTFVLVLGIGPNWTIYIDVWLAFHTHPLAMDVCNVIKFLTFWGYCYALMVISPAMVGISYGISLKKGQHDQMKESI